MLKTLKNRDFVYLWLGQMVSRLGDGIHEIALAWLVLELTGSALSMGAILAVSITPNLLFGLPAGVFVDRFNRKYIMVLADFARTAIVLVIPVTYFLGGLQLWMIFAVAFLTSTAEAFAGPARQSSIPNLVEEKNLDPANSLMQMTRAVSSLFGLSLGGAVVAIFGPANSFYLDSFSFLLSTVFISRIAYKPAFREVAESLYQDIVIKTKRGLNYVINDPFIKRLIIIAAGINFIIAPINVIIPYFIKEEMGLSASIYGIMASCLSVGMVLGSMIIGNVSVHRGKSLGSGILGSGVSLVFFSVFYLLSQSLLLPTMVLIGLLSLTLAGVGISTSFSNVPIHTLLQKTTEDSKRGRVMSIVGMGTMVAMPMAYGLSGFLLEQIGAIPLLFGIGSLTAIGATACFKSREIMAAQ
ncbi:MAG: MFS transporter [Candidatus Bipolaricaulota bacterium]